LNLNNVLPVQPSLKLSPQKEDSKESIVQINAENVFMQETGGQRRKQNERPCSFPI